MAQPPYAETQLKFAREHGGIQTRDNRTNTLRDEREQRLALRSDIRRRAEALLAAVERAERADERLASEETALWQDEERLGQLHPKGWSPDLSDAVVRHGNTTQRLTDELAALQGDTKRLAELIAAAAPLCAEAEAALRGDARGARFGVSTAASSA